MKKTITLALAALVLLFALTSCGSKNRDAWTESVTEEFRPITVCKYGKLISASFDTIANIKIEDNNFEHFKAYIDDLKADGFEYYEIASIPENVTENDGQSSWRGSKDGVYLQLIFSSDDSANRDAFGCNIQIFGYLSDPWKDIGKDSGEDKDGKKDDKKDDKADEKAGEETEKETEKEG